MKKTLLVLLVVVFTISQSKSNNVTVANCAPPTASTTLEVNNVRAKLLNGGDLWWGPGGQGYEIPKGSNKQYITAGAIWMSGFDGGGNLHTAGQTYRQRGMDFWPGPIDSASGSTDSVTCKTWDRFFSVKRESVLSAKYGFGADSNVLNWPSIAPFVDANGNGMYDPSTGDYPIFEPGVPANVPSEMVWWVMNDVGNSHTAYVGGLPMGVEIQATAFAYSTALSEAINNSTMYRYRIINKSNTSLYNVTVGQFLDADIGGSDDDYVGCNLTIPGGLFYCYNADSSDPSLGNKPPALGISYLRTFKDENGNSIPPSSFMFFTNQGVTGINSDPSNSVELNRYLHSYWADGAFLSYGTPNGRGGAQQTAYAFPGNLNDVNSWKETDVPGDRRLLPAIGPFTLQPGGFAEEIFAVVWAQSDTNGNIGSVNKLIASAQEIQAASDNHFSAFNTGINSSKDLTVNFFPNPVKDKCYINIENKNNENIVVKLFNTTGKLMLTKNFDPARRIELDLENFEKGVYVLSVQQGAKTSSIKIIK